MSLQSAVHGEFEKKYLMFEKNIVRNIYNYFLLNLR